MNIPHEYVPGELQTQLFGDPLEVCEVCVYPREHFYHQPNSDESLASRVANLSGQVIGLRQERDLATRLIEQLKAQAEIDTAALAEWRALADDLAAALEGFWGIGFQLNDADHPDVVAALARYREARK